VFCFCSCCLLGHFIHSSADEIIHVDLDFPEKNGEFFIERINEVKAGSELVDQIKIYLPHIVDLWDFSKYQAHLVLNGKGLLVQKPSVPHFLLHNYEELYEMEQSRCIHTEQAHTINVNRILGDAYRQLRTILLVFPPDVTCSAAISPKGNQKIKITMRSLALNYELGKGKIATSQQYLPASWLLHILGDERSLLKLVDEDDDEIVNAFKGMHVKKP
jgi:hypothetical protein